MPPRPLVRTTAQQQWERANLARKIRFIRQLAWLPRASSPLPPPPLVCAVCDKSHADDPDLVMARWHDDDICLDCLENRPGKEDAEAEALGMRYPLTQAQYRAQGGGCCPRCQSGELSGQSFDLAEDLVSQERMCQDCAHVWSAYYRLAGYVRAGAAGDRDFDAVLRTVVVETPAS